MWANHDSDAAMKFHEATSDWHSTWNGKDSAMQVRSCFCCFFFGLFPFGHIRTQNMSSCWLFAWFWRVPLSAEMKMCLLYPPPLVPTQQYNENKDETKETSHTHTHTPLFPPCNIFQHNQVESVKVWQTDADYFMEPRAAATAAAAAASNSGEDAEDATEGAADLASAEDGWSSGSSEGGSRTGPLLYVVCSLFGGVLGGVAVGWWLNGGRVGSPQRSYQTINNRGAAPTTP